MEEKNEQKSERSKFMRKKFELGGLTKAQKTLPPKLQALIQKKKKKKETKIYDGNGYGG
jgi:hypothetical protein